MKYRIHEIKLKIGEDKSEIPRKIMRKLGKQGVGLCIEGWKIVRESIDARDKANIRIVYSIDFTVNNGAELRPVSGLRVEKAPDSTYSRPMPGNVDMKNPPVIAGFGPCGMFAALLLSEMGYRPVILERGKEIAERVQDVALFWNKGILNPESNVQFGEGGAGTFSDGKLTTGIKDKRIAKVLFELASAGGGEELLYKQKPHIGTDVLRDVVANLRKTIEKNGGQFRFSTKLTDILVRDGALAGIVTEQGEVIETETLILAIGHSARDTFRALFDVGIFMEQKPFSIGVRIEHPQSLINRAQYGTEDDSGLGAASYKLAHHCENGRGVYTFCMCPGGEVITASSQAGGVVTNGMSRRARDGAFANSGLLVDVRTSDFASGSPLAGMEFQEKYERLAFKNGGGNYKPPQTTWGAFADREENAEPVRNSLPDFAVEAMVEAMPHLGKKLTGFDSREAVLTAVETRSSSPVRIRRDEKCMSNIPGIYPGGEGAGYAGGITSAAVDGLRIAEEVVKLYRPVKGGD